MSCFHLWIQENPAWWLLEGRAERALPLTTSRAQPPQSEGKFRIFPAWPIIRPDMHPGVPEQPHKHRHDIPVCPHHLCVVCTHTQDPVHPHCPCLPHRGFLPQHTELHTSFLPLPLPLHCTTKENHNKPTLLFFFLLLSSREWFFLLNLHQNLGTKLERLKKHSVFLLYLCQGKKFSYSYEIHGTLCVEMCQFGQMNFSKVHSSIPAFACSTPHPLSFCDLHYMMPLHVSGGPPKGHHKALCKA